MEQKNNTWTTPVYNTWKPVTYTGILIWKRKRSSTKSNRTPRVLTDRHSFNRWTSTSSHTVVTSSRLYNRISRRTCFRERIIWILVSCCFVSSDAGFSLFSPTNECCQTKWITLLQCWSENHAICNGYDSCGRS